MKKLFLTIAVALGVFSAASAQGNMWVGGTAGVWSSKVKGGDSQLSFKVMPEFGYILVVLILTEVLILIAKL